MTTLINGLPWCGECIYSREHINDPKSHCYDCKKRNKFIKAVEENSTEPDFDNMPIEKINQYLQDHGYDPKQVGLRGKILVDALIENMKMREIIQMFLNDPGGCPFCDYGVLRKPNIPEKDHDDDCPYKIAHDYLDNKPSVSDVSVTQDVSTDIKTPQSIENTNPDYYKDELYLDEDFRMLAKTYPADVSAIGVTTLIDYVEAVEAELARLNDELETMKQYIEALENEPIRSRSVIKRLRIQTGMEER